MLLHLRTLRLVAVGWLALAVSVGAAQTFPIHWGNPPAIQTRDMRPLPGGYGHGSTTLANWIQQNLDRDAAGDSAPRGVVVGKGVRAMGELRERGKVTLSIDGPPEQGRRYTASVRLLHKSGSPADIISLEKARTTSAGPEGKTSWVLSFTPGKPGPWSYRVSFLEGKMPVEPYHGRSGTFTIAPAAPSER
jgi:hypothetical protein